MYLLLELNSHPENYALVSFSVTLLCHGIPTDHSCPYIILLFIKSSGSNAKERIQISFNCLTDGMTNNSNI